MEVGVLWAGLLFPARKVGMAPETSDGPSAGRRLGTNARFVFDQEARCQMPPLIELVKRRYLGFAAVERVSAARMEGAAGRGVRGRRNISGQIDGLTFSGGSPH